MSVPNYHSCRSHEQPGPGSHPRRPKGRQGKGAGVGQTKEAWMSWLFASIVLVFCCFPTTGLGQHFRRDFFESEDTTWVKGPSNVEYIEKSHIRTNQAAHDGQRSEYIKIQAKHGSHIYYQYPIGRAKITEELAISVYVKANVQGVQLVARVVLPNVRDSGSIKDRMTTLLRGDVYTSPGRWRRLDLANLPKLLQEQKHLMQRQLREQIDTSGAYIDAIMLNVYGGAGPNEIWIDDLDIGPLAEPVAPPEPHPGQPSDNPNEVRRGAMVKFDAGHLTVGQYRYLIRGIRHTDTPLAVLRKAGFNTLWVEDEANDTVLYEAARRGFWLVPKLPLMSTGHLVSRKVAKFPQSPAVLFWDVGTALEAEQAQTVGQLARAIQNVHPVQRPLSANVWSGFDQYSQTVNIVGVHRWPLMTGLDLQDYKTWLTQRRLLASPGTYMLTWIQNHTPESHLQLLHEQSDPSTRESKQKDDASAEPFGPLPAQVRLLTYTALGAGYKGVAYWSDRFLADTHQGRDRLYGVALLNKELEMLEPMLLATPGAPKWIKTSNPNVEAAVFRTSRGVLVLPMWLGTGSQFVPGQSATNKLEILVPQVSQAMQAWEVTPGEVRSLNVRREPGGLKVTLPEFGLTTAVVFTGDTKLVVWFQERAQWWRKSAAHFAHNQAQLELEKVQRVQSQLKRLGQAVSESDELLARANARLLSARAKWNKGLFGGAYREAQRALRPVRILQRMQWEKAVRGLSSPVAVPHAVSYYTLPKFWQMVGAIRQTAPGGNLLVDGDFEDLGQKGPPTWELERIDNLDPVDLRALRVNAKTKDFGTEPKQGQVCAMLHVAAKDPGRPPGALERTYLAITSRPVKLRPGSLVRVSYWIKIPRPIQASVDGALVFDSAGGEPLAIRLKEATTVVDPNTRRRQVGWKKYSVFRRVPANGIVQVTCALSGIGTVYFDDVRVEPLQGGSNAVARNDPPRH